MFTDSKEANAENIEAALKFVEELKASEGPADVYRVFELVKTIILLILFKPFSLRTKTNSIIEPWRSSTTHQQ